MGMLTNAGAARAAGEIIGLINTKIDENSDKPEITAVLQELKTKVREIKDTADEGWY